MRAPDGFRSELSCVGKRQYLTWTHAAYDAREMRRRSKSRRAGVYRCHWCGRIHVGRQDRERWRFERRLKESA